MPDSTSIIDTLIQLYNDHTSGNHGFQSSYPAPPIIASHSPHKYFSLLTNFWNSFNQTERKKLILYLSGGFLFFYISLPTLFPSFYSSKGYNKSGKMFSKRPDKQVTGLINLTTDCFANSTLQSLAALPSLNNYLNDISKYHSTVLGVCKSSAPDLNAPLIPLHDALIDILYKLQETILTSRVISVWDFLHTLERIYKSKISRNQHDAHELLQLILETLNAEYTRTRKFVNKHATVFDKIFQENGIPDFPFQSEISSKLICSKCGKKSSANYNPMMILSMAVPQKTSIKIQSLIRDTLKESIDDYSCLCCKINFILYSNENSNLSPEDRNILTELKDLIVNNKLLINDDLPQEQETFVDNYPGIKHPSIKSTVYKTTDFLIAPKVLPIHLSRSIFENSQAWRNSCNVEYEEYITLTVDEIEKQDFQEKIIKKNANKGVQISDSSEETDNDSIGAESFPSTKHASSIIQEKPEDEFIDNKSVASDEVDYHSDSDKSDSVSENSNDDDGEDDENLDEDIDDEDDDDKLAEGDDGTPSQRPMFKPSYSSERFPSSNNVRSNGGTSSGTGISTDFSSAEAGTTFTPTTSVSDMVNDSNVQVSEPQTTMKTYRYKLRAVIRHQGSHLSGHYECYRRKPVFYKDSNTGEYYTKFPKLIDSRISRQEGMIAAVQTLNIQSDVSNSERSENEDDTEDDKEGEKENDNSSADESSTRPRRSPSLSKRLRSSFSSLRRSSRSSSFGFSTPPTFENQPSSVSSSFDDTTNSLSNKNSTSNENNLSSNGNGPTKKTKILSTSIKYPFWRISDSKIKEVSSINDVLNDSKAVYMLFYERVD